MAIVKYGSIIQEIKGSVGGSVFRKSGNFHQMFNKSNVGTGRGQINGGKPENMSVIGGYWNSLTDTEKDDWSDIADDINWVDRFGNLYNPTGYQFFLNVMTYRLYIGNTSASPANRDLNVTQAGVSTPRIFANGSFQPFFNSVSVPMWYIFKLRPARTQFDRTRGLFQQFVGALLISTPGTKFLNVLSNGYSKKLKPGNWVQVSYTIVNGWGYNEIRNHYTIEVE